MNGSLPLVLQLDVAGNPHSWINYEKASYYVAKDLVAWEATEQNFTLKGGQSRLTGRQSEMTINTIIAVRGQLSSQRYASMNYVHLTNASLFNRDQNVCAYCGDTFTRCSLSRDHVIPVSKGGPNTWMNVVTACKSCNRKKSDKLLHEIDMELLYVPYVPNRAEYLILQNRNILQDQMEFLLKRVPPESRIHNIYNQ